MYLISREKTLLKNRFFGEDEPNLCRTMTESGEVVTVPHLYRFPLPNTRVGNTEKVYTLGARGRSYLQSLGMDVDWYFRPFKVAGMTYQNRLHPLTVTRFLIAAQVFVESSFRV